MSRNLFRNECKYYISYPVARLLEQRLEKIFVRDPYSESNGAYRIRSLYFDNPQRQAYFDKLSGVADREKYRIRFYNRSDSFIQLEKKKKVGDKILKTGESLSRGEAERLVRGDSEFLLNSEKPLLCEFAARARFEKLSPLVFVDYTRRAFLYSSSNLRITLDSNVTETAFRGSLFDFSQPAIPVLEPQQVILEVKFDGVLPPLARALLADIPAVGAAISKYCKCCEMLF